MRGKRGVKPQMAQISQMKGLENASAWGERVGVSAYVDGNATGFTWLTGTAPANRER
jgi:hypothetical protein